MERKICCISLIKEEIMDLAFYGMQMLHHLKKTGLMTFYCLTQEMGIILQIHANQKERNSCIQENIIDDLQTREKAEHFSTGE